MKPIYFAFILSLTACSPSPELTSHRTWKNGAVRELGLGPENTTLKDHEHGCEYSGIPKGSDESGEIYFKAGKNCDKTIHPVKSKYNSAGNALHVCTDYSNGDHTCERFR